MTIDWIQVSLIIIGLLMGFFGGYYAKVKKLAEELTKLGSVIVNALKDDKITLDELRDILKEARDVKEAIEKVLNKTV